MHEDVDQDAVLRARTVLLGSGRPTRRQEVEACRVLARVSPATYLPRLSKALIYLGFSDEYRKLGEAQLALYEEAVEVARAVDPSDPQHTDLLMNALRWKQHQLFELARRPEGLAVREEMAGLDRRTSGADPDTPAGLGVELWARGLAEEGRHREAAELFEKLVRRARPAGPSEGAFAWHLLEWTAEAEAAGLRQTALAATGELVERERDQLAAGRTGTRSLFFALLRLAELHEGYARADEASAALDEAAALLAELAAHGESKQWSGYQSTYWVVLLGLSGRAAELPAPGRAAPPLGAHFHEWSPDLRQSYFAELPALRDAVEAAQDPGERFRLHRKLMIRSVLHAESGHRNRFFELLLPLFDEGVALARQTADPAPVARALLDRASALTAAQRFADALADFQEALEVRRHKDPQR
ncbi:hypothetical protein [Streptomyces sp. NPDC005485]|uniref:hypothetical protein n=1 Tax=Streptomyces sp. NPDC005485 TaxID=3155591 RepID=UPI0033AE37BC